MGTQEQLFFNDYAINSERLDRREFATVQFNKMYLQFRLLEESLSEESAKNALERIVNLIKGNENFFKDINEAMTEHVLSQSFYNSRNPHSIKNIIMSAL